MIAYIMSDITIVLKGQKILKFYLLLIGLFFLVIKGKENFGGSRFHPQQLFWIEIDSFELCINGI